LFNFKQTGRKRSRQPGGDGGSKNDSIVDKTERSCTRYVFPLSRYCPTWQP